MVVPGMRRSPDRMCCDRDSWENESWCIELCAELFIGLATAVPRSREESREPALPGDCDRLMRSIAVGRLRIVSGDSNEDPADEFRMCLVLRAGKVGTGLLSFRSRW